ncbi:MAG: hypothetical protein ACLQVD_22835 [Capsulimonadaceae bacterium]
MVISVPAGVYHFTLDQDEQTILLPSGAVIKGEPGTVFEFSGWGRPLLAAVDQSQIEISGITFEFSGTDDWTSASVRHPRPLFGWPAVIPPYEYASTLAFMGSDHVYIHDCDFHGASTNNIQNCAIEFRGHWDGSYFRAVSANRIENCSVADCCQGIGAGQQAGLEIRNIHMPRYSEDCVQLYGPGHLVYLYQPPLEKDGTPKGDPSTDVQLEDITDDGVRVGTVGYTSGGSAISAKWVTHGYFHHIVSHRQEGLLNFIGLKDTEVSDCSFENNDPDSDSYGVIYGIGATMPGKYTKSENDTFKDITLIKHNSDVALISLIDPQLISNSTFTDIHLVKDTNPGDKSAAIDIAADHCTARGLMVDAGRAADVINVRSASHDNDIEVGLPHQPTDRDRIRMTPTRDKDSGQMLTPGVNRIRLFQSNQ